MALVKIGCCGFPAVKTEYARHFQTVEVQQTFYQPPQIATLERWRAMMPPEFEFTLKAWQLITHTCKSPTYRRLKVKLTEPELRRCGGFRSNAVVRRAWETTRACAGALNARYVLFQCPASFDSKPQNLARMRKFFGSIDRHKLKLLWEPRGNWDGNLVRALCRELDLIHVVDPFVSPTTSPELIYFRLHGGKGFAHVFTDDELMHLARLIPPDAPAYVMFNNRSMLADARRFQSLAKSAGGISIS